MFPSNFAHSENPTNWNMAFDSVVVKFFYLICSAHAAGTNDRWWQLMSFFDGHEPTSVSSTTFHLVRGKTFQSSIRAMKFLPAHTIKSSNQLDTKTSFLYSRVKPSCPFDAERTAKDFVSICSRFSSTLKFVFFLFFYWLSFFRLNLAVVLLRACKVIWWNSNLSDRKLFTIDGVTATKSSIDTKPVNFYSPAIQWVRFNCVRHRRWKELKHNCAFNQFPLRFATAFLPSSCLVHLSYLAANIKTHCNQK